MSANDQGTEWLPTLELILGAASAGANQKAADYEQANVEFSAEISVIEQELQAIDSKRGTQDAFIRFAELLLTEVSRAWQPRQVERR